MNTPDGFHFTRATLEQLFAALLFGATTALVASGAIAMSLQSPLLAG
jgi:hypothetical protein